MIAHGGCGATLALCTCTLIMLLIMEAGAIWVTFHAAKRMLRPCCASCCVYLDNLLHVTCGGMVACCGGVIGVRLNGSLAAQPQPEGGGVCYGAVRAAVPRALPYESELKS